MTVAERPGEGRRKWPCKGLIGRVKSYIMCRWTKLKMYAVKPKATTKNTK